MNIPVTVYEDVTGSGLNYFDTMYENSPVKIIDDRIYLVTVVNKEDCIDCGINGRDMNQAGVVHCLNCGKEVGQ